MGRIIFIIGCGEIPAPAAPHSKSQPASRAGAVLLADALVISLMARFRRGCVFLFRCTRALLIAGVAAGTRHVTCASRLAVAASVGLLAGLLGFSFGALRMLRAAGVTRVGNKHVATRAFAAVS